jgi:glyoxylase-like metal-dependent hydrolase (beta-lactamase superfamily II)
MRSLIVMLTALALLVPCTTLAQDGKAGIEAVGRALGEPGLKSIEYNAGGTIFQFGQSQAPGQSWPRFNIKSLTRSVNYETSSGRVDWVRTQALDPPRGGGVQPIRGEQRQIFVVSGGQAWNVMGDAAIPAPISLMERQTQLWMTPHGVVKAALANNATKQGPVIAFTLPNRVPVKATVNAQNLIERVEVAIPNPVLGDTPMEVTYAEYKDYGGVKFPAKIRQSAGGSPSLDLTVTDVRPNAAVEIPVPDAVKQAGNPYARVATQMVADGVWYLTGGTHHSVLIEMKDHLILCEAPLNDERTLAVIAEARNLVPGKPVRYVVNSHHHFDHAGGLRAAAGEGLTVITHEINRAYVERNLAAPAKIEPDHLAKSGKKGMVEGVKDKRVLTDGTRTVEIHHIAGVLHDDGLLMVYLPKEKLLVQADTFTPVPAGTAPPMPPSPFNVGLADNITRLGLAVDNHLPLHGRMVPMAELNRQIGKSN